jgi:hypothetical protein
VRDVLAELETIPAGPFTLGPTEESAFQDWYSGWAQKLNLNPNPDDTKHFYDYRAAFKAGAEPTAKSDWHWPSEFKLEGHPRMIVAGVNTKTGRSVKTGPRDVLAELEEGGARKEPVFVKPDKWNEQIKPTLIETGKQIFEMPKSLGEVGLSAASGAIGWVVGSGLGIAEATKPGATRESVTAAAEDAAQRLSYEPKTQPAKVLMGKAGRAIEAVTGPAKEAAALVGESWNSPFLESVLKFAGEAATFEAVGAAAKVKPKVPEWYRRMTVRERGLVEGIKADLANGEFTPAQIRELWKDPTNRAELLKRYQGVGGEPGKTAKAPFAEPPTGKALPEGQGFELRPTAGEVRDILAEMGEPGPRALPPGQTFELQGQPYSPTERALEANAPTTKALPYPEGVGEGFTSRPSVPEEPVTSKAGTPFKTRNGAMGALKKEGMDWQLYHVVPVEGGFAITRRQGQEFRTPNTPKVDELDRIRTQVKAEDEARRNGTFIEPESPAVPAPVAQAERLPAGMGVGPSGGETVDPGADLPPAKRPAGGPENLVTYLQRNGFVNLGEYADKTGDAWSRFHGKRSKDRSREYGDVAAVSRQAGKLKMDEAAANLNAEGWGPQAPTGRAWTPDSLYNVLASGQGRNVFAPEKMDAIIERRLNKEWEQHYADLQAEFEAEGIDPAAISKAKTDIEGTLLDEIKSDGFSVLDEEAALKEISDFLMDLRPSERGAKLEKIWGPEEEFDAWYDGEGPDRRRHRAANDHAADLEYAIKNGHTGDVEGILKDIQSRLDPWDYYAYEQVRKAGRKSPRPAAGTDRGSGEVPASKGADLPAGKTGSLPGVSPAETFDLTNPETHWSNLQPRDKGPQPGSLFPKAKESPEGQGRLFEKGRGPIGSERGSIPIPEEIVKTIRESKLSQAMPHLEDLGRSIYESGKTKYFDWQRGMKAALGDLWERFKGYMVDLHKRLSKGQIGPLKNQKGAIGRDIYAQNRQIQEKGPARKIGAEVRDVIDGIKSLADEYLGAISTRLENIDPSLRTQLRRMEMNSGIEKEKAIRRVEPMLQKIKAMPKEDRLDFDLARKNGDAVKLKAIIDKYDMWPEYTNGTRTVLNELYKKAQAVGFDVGYRKHFHPRVIKDPKGFLEYMYKQADWPVLEKAIRDKEAELGRYLKDDEKASLINSLIRGYGGGQISLSKPGQLKAREIEIVTPDLNRYYMDSDGALLQYISAVTDAIEMRKAFGVKAKGAISPDDTIGHYILDLLEKGKIKPEQEPTLREIYSARFNEVGTRGVIGLYKNLSYIDTMGSPISAITQVGDLAWALYKNGIKGTANAMIPAIKGKSPITKEDIGIDMIAKEFADTSKAAHTLANVFKAIGLTKIDNIGKETLINSTITKAQRQAKDPKQAAALRRELEPIFGEETDALIKDLAKGTISENVKLYAFNTLSDFQPISLSEMPQKYLSGGNGRIFYMLKSFTLKQFDIYRREVFRQIANEGTRLQGVKNLLKLTAAFVAANASADVIKAIILNRNIDPGDLAIDNLLRLFGISKFVTWKAREEGVGSAMVRQIAPPFKLADAITKDIVTAGDEKGLETPQSIPVVGKLYYWWFGKGAKKTERQERKETKLNSLRGLKELD